MAKKIDKESKIQDEPPTAGLSFMIGWILFAVILCPLGVLASFYIKLNKMLGVKLIQSLPLGCFLGLIVALIPAFIFMHYSMKKLKKK